MKKGFFKKSIGFFLAAIMVFSVIPFTGMKVDAATEGSWGTNNGTDIGGRVWYCVSGASTKYPLTAKNTSSTVDKYAADWQYWCQGASKYSAMRGYGCLVVALSKLLVETGMADKNETVFNPDVFFEYGVNAGYFNSSDTYCTGNPAIAYAKLCGGELKKVGSVALSGNITNADADKIMAKINEGYYVVLHYSGHHAYIGRKASLEAGEPIVLDSSSANSYNYHWNRTFKGMTNEPFTSFDYYSVVSTPSGSSTDTLSNVSSVNAYMILNTDNVPVHITPAAGGEVVKYLPKGSVIYFSQKGTNSAGNTWYKLGTGEGRYDDVSGYIYGNYVSTMPTSGAYKIHSDMQANVILRSTQSTSGSVVASLGPNAEFTISSVSGSWAYATYGGKTGWLHIGYAKYIGTISCTTHSYGSWTTTKSATCTASGTEQRKCSICGNTETRTVAALGHSYTTKVTPPTCTSQGYTTHTCSRCGSSYNDTYTSAAGHKYDNACDTTCNVCGAVRSTSHSFGAWTVVYNPTCTEMGYEDRMCSSCYTIEGRTIPALGHSYTTKVTAPTCTEQGYTTHTCSRCGDSYNDTYTSAAGHKYDNACDTTCNVCGATRTITHTYGSWTTTKAATCTASGTEKRTCTICGKTETRTTAALGHNYAIKTVEPTCTAQGYTMHTCSRCGDSYKDTYVAAKGHTWNSGVVTKAATETEKGVKTYTCTVCGATKTEEIPILEHTHKYDQKNTSSAYLKSAATCTAAAEYYYSCSCGEKGTSSFTSGSALGHKYTTKVTAPTCTAQGYTTHTCSRCGDSYKDTYVAAAGHKWNDGVVTQPATASSEGIKTYTCTVCGEKKTEKIPPVQIDETLTVDVKDVTAYTGNEFTVVFDYKGIDGIRSFGIWFDYDTDAFEFVGGKCLLPGYTIFDVSEKDGMIAAFETPASIGNVGELTFRVKDGAKDGVYTMSFDCHAEDAACSAHALPVNGKITVMSYVRGDVDASGAVNSMDATYLLRYTMRASKYPINQSGDMNGDGSVNSIDALYLLRHTMRPDKYPLA